MAISIPTPRHGDNYAKDRDGWMAKDLILQPMFLVALQDDVESLPAKIATTNTT